MAIHLRPVFRALVTRLSADATLAGLAAGGVHQNSAPRTATYRYVVFSVQDAQIRPTFDNPDGTEGAGTFMELVLTIKVQDRSLSAEAAALAYARVHDLIIPDAPLAALFEDGHELMGVQRETPIAYDEDEGESKIQHVGGVYRFRVQLEA